MALTNFDGTWAVWPIAATIPGVVTGELGAPLHPEAARARFTATVAHPRWASAGDPVALIAPASGAT